MARESDELEPTEVETVQAEQAAEETSTEDTSADESNTEIDPEFDPNSPEYNSAKAEDEAHDLASAAASEEAEAKSAEEPKAEEPKGPTEAELLEAFKNAAVQALSGQGRDESTGTLSAADIAPVAKAYTALGISTKNKAKEHLQAQMTEAMNGAKFLEARSYLDLLNGLKSGVKKETVQKPPVDPTEAHVAKVTALLLSPNLVLPVEGVASDWQAKAQAKATELSSQVVAYRTWMLENGDKPTEEQASAPEVDEIVLAAAAAARGRSVARKAASTGTGTPRAPRAASTSTGDGTRRNIAEHIKSAFADVPVGTFLTIGEIVKHKSAEYGQDEPSQGAVAARLFPGGDGSKCNVPGIKAEQRDKKGAVKVA